MRSTTRSSRLSNASATPSPVFALVREYGTFGNAPRSHFVSCGPITPRARSALFNRRAYGRSPATIRTASTHAGVWYRVGGRLRSATHRKPCAPQNIASRNASRGACSPMRSNRATCASTIWPAATCLLNDRRYSLLPSVPRYASSNVLNTYRWIREVLPTARSPTRQSFSFIFRICPDIRATHGASGLETNPSRRRPDTLREGTGCPFDGGSHALRGGSARRGRAMPSSGPCVVRPPPLREDRGRPRPAAAGGAGGSAAGDRTGVRERLGREGGRPRRRRAGAVAGAERGSRVRSRDGDRPYRKRRTLQARSHESHVLVGEP